MNIAVVQPGETLWQIAVRNGVTTAQLAQANGITDPSRLVPGMALVVPKETRYVVRPGDTLWRIGQLFGTTATAIAARNNISLTSWIYPGQVLIIPPRSYPTLEVNAYQANLGQQGAATTAEAAPYVTYISPFSASITETGDVRVPNMSLINQAAHTNGAATLLTITNFAENHFSSELANAFLNNTAAQDRALDQVLEVLRRDGHHGLNVDFEYIFPSDREAYNNFMRRAAPRLHGAGFSLSAALAPKVSAGQVGLLYEAHDYPVHGEVDDFVILMTYEWGYRSGPPLPVAPLDQVRRVLDYAVTAIPRNKILMGMPMYGYDWKLPYQRGVTVAETLSPVRATDRAIQYGVPIQYDTTSQSPFYRYRDAAGSDHVVWFEDARSVQAKFDTIKEYGLRGPSYWVLGNPFPQLWQLTTPNFRVRKLT